MKILQISDPHLMSRPEGRLKNVPTAESLQETLELARKVCPDPERVIWTGDLSHEETVDGYKLLKDLVGDWFERSRFLSGNHDDPQALQQVLGTPGLLSTGPVSFVENVSGWRLIGVNTHWPGKSAGRLPVDQLSDSNTPWHGPPDLPALLFMHHPPIDIGCPWLDRIRLQNVEALQQLVGSTTDIRAIFCGHVHQEYVGDLAGVPVFTAPSTAVQFGNTAEFCLEMHPPGFRLIDLHGDDVDTRVFRCASLKHVPVAD